MDAFYEKIDRLKVDELIRLPGREVPGTDTIYSRARLNLSRLAVHRVDDEFVIVRLK